MKMKKIPNKLGILDEVHDISHEAQGAYAWISMDRRYGERLESLLGSPDILSQERSLS